MASAVDGAVIVGGGPSGLAAGIELRRRRIGPVTVIEREEEAGGIPRHSDHAGFGVRDLHRLLSGPRYARRYAALSLATARPAHLRHQARDATLVLAQASDQLGQGHTAYRYQTLANPRRSCSPPDAGSARARRAWSRDRVPPG